MDSLNLSANSMEDFTIRIDLSVECWSYRNSMSHLGYLTTEFVQEMLVTFPSLYALTMILKQYLQNRNLLNIYQGMYLVYFPEKLAINIIAIVAIIEMLNAIVFKNFCRITLKNYKKAFTKQIHSILSIKYSKKHEFTTQKN